MRKGHDRGEKKRKNGGETGKKREKTDDYSGHYVIASSRPQKRRPLERRPLEPIKLEMSHTKRLIKGSFQHNTSLAEMLHNYVLILV